MVTQCLLIVLATVIGQVVSGPNEPAVELRLGLRTGHDELYEFSNFWQRSVVVKTTSGNQPVEVPSGTTGSSVTIRFRQKVRSVDPNGNAVLDVRIDGLKVFEEQVGDPIIDFDSSRDQTGPLAWLVGKTYQLLLAPDGSVLDIKGMPDLQQVLSKGSDKDQSRKASELASRQYLRQMHTVWGLASCGPGPHQKGYSWSDLRTVSFANLGTRTFERVYRLKDIEQVDGHTIAVVEMTGALASNTVQQAYKQDPKIKALMDRMDFQFTYEGQLRLDLTSGCLDLASEQLEVNWLAVDPRVQLTDKAAEPNTISMRSVHGLQIKRVVPDVNDQAGIGPVSCRLRFEVGRPLAYRCLSKRDIRICWDPNADPNRRSDTVSTMNETMDMVIGMEPVRIEPDGSTQLQVQVRSVSINRGRLSGDVPSPGTDPVKLLEGRGFSLRVASNGRIVDANSLDMLLKEVGQSAFRQDPRYGRVKDPDMISDVVATVWFLWDAISSMDPNGVEPGQGWTSVLSVPTPMVSRKARQVSYSLERIEQTDTGRIALITGRYSLSDRPAPTTWPIPYAGRFRVSGTFGFLGAYKFLGLEGSGTDRFNIDAGTWEGTTQRMQYILQAAVPFPFARGTSGNPVITIDQSIEVRRLDGRS